METRPKYIDQKNFYGNVGVNLGFNKSSSNTKSHNESAVVTTIRGKDENSSITYNNVKNIDYVGTQAQNTKFIYNNVENINKSAVELNNSYSSSSKSNGISTGATIGYGDGVQTEANAVSISASKSNMNTNGTTYQNGRFVNVDEVHNNTKNMTLSGFNQEGGTVTGNIENLTIESKQNTSTTTGSTKGGSLSISPSGMPSGSVNYSKTNGERKVVDNASTFIIGDGSNLKVGKVENTAGAIGATGSGKLSIDEYVGHNLENVDKSKTVGGSVGISSSEISSIGINYSDKKQEGITKNTVIGKVEIAKSSGDEINKDLGSMTEVTKDRDFKTNIELESQTIDYIKNPEKFKEDIQKAKNEITDMGNVVENTINPKGEDKRNIFANLRAQRGATTFYNVVGSRAEALNEALKNGTINEEQFKEEVREVIKGYGKDIGVDFEVVYLDEATMPKDAKGSTGAAFIDKETGKMLIPIDVNKIKDTGSLWGVISEEVSHIKDGLAGRQDLEVAKDETNKEKGLESLGRPVNDYFKNKLGDDNSSDISLTTDGIDLTNADVGEKVGDVFLKSEIDAAGGVDKVLRIDPNSRLIDAPDLYRTAIGSVGVLGSALRGTKSYGIIKSGIFLLKMPDPTGWSKIVGTGVTIYGVVEGLFSISDGIESGQDIYYGITNQKNKKSINFGKELLGEENYMIFNITSAEGAQKVYQYADYTRVMVDGEKAKRELTVNITDQGQNADVSTKNNQPLYREKTKKENSNSQSQRKENKNTPKDKAEAYEKEELNPQKQDLKKSEYLYKEFEKNLEAEAKMQGVPDKANYQHIIYGEINRRGNAVGGHSLLGGDVRRASNSPITNYSNGVYKMRIEVKDANGNWIPKAAETTMYPVTWSETRIKYEVSEAFANWKKSTQNYNATQKWSGVSPSGVTIEGFVQNDYITTAYPKPPTP